MKIVTDYSDGTFTMTPWRGHGVYAEIPLPVWWLYRFYNWQGGIWHRYLRRIDNEEIYNK